LQSPFVAAVAELFRFGLAVVLPGGKSACMEGVGAGIALVVIVVIGVVIWMASMSMDKDRIMAYLQERGGRIVSINWAPFGRGWFGEKNDRIYEVVYYDREGNQHWATCKTSLFSGVYWTEDRITHRKAKWYAGLPPRNEPGDPVIRHIPDAEEERVEREAAEILGLSSSESATTESLDEEIARLKRRLAELEQQKQKRGA
jgi:hypothetical protein